jgi:hypothetical protein
VGLETLGQKMQYIQWLFGGAVIRQRSQLLLAEAVALLGPQGPSGATTRRGYKGEEHRAVVTDRSAIGIAIAGVIVGRSYSKTDRL